MALFEKTNGKLFQLVPIEYDKGLKEIDERIAQLQANIAELEIMKKKLQNVNADKPEMEGLP